MRWFPVIIFRSPVVTPDLWVCCCKSGNRLDYHPLITTPLSSSQSVCQWDSKGRREDTVDEVNLVKWCDDWSSSLHLHNISTALLVPMNSQWPFKYKYIEWNISEQESVFRMSAEKTCDKNQLTHEVKEIMGRVQLCSSGTGHAEWLHRNSCKKRAHFVK